MTDQTTETRVAALTTDPELLALLERAKNLPPPTAVEKVEQKLSWVRGEMLFDGKLTEAEVDALLLKIPEFEILSQLRAAWKREAALRETVEWYGENARLCRLIHSGGDEGRKALSDDGGNRARTALQETPR